MTLAANYSGLESDIKEFWVEFPHIETLNNNVVMPAEVALIIPEAINQGWKPREKGALLSFKLSGRKLEALINEKR